MTSSKFPFESYEARKSLDMSVIIPNSAREDLNNALNSLREFERKFEKIRKTAEILKIERDKDERLDEMAAGYQLARDSSIELLDLILDEEF